MKLSHVIEGLEVRVVSGSLEAEVRGLCIDSRRLAKGDMFVALRGAGFDGRDFIGEAIGAGASAVLMEGAGSAPVHEVPCVMVKDARAALARVAGNFHGHPSEGMDVLGVTGTNGKTTTAYLIRAMLRAAGHSVGMIGTISYMIGEEAKEAPFTTPEAPEFQGLLKKMLEAGCGYVVSEVSSHALAQMRVDGTKFRAAVFTNLTRDHLDFHKGMRSYFDAKKRLFMELLEGASIVNVDDTYGAELASVLKGNVLTFGLETEADIMARDISNTREGLSFDLVTGDIVSGRGSLRIESPLVGMFNVYNILAAAGACLALGVEGHHIAAGVKHMQPVEGRFRRVEEGQDFLCIVDFAHTEDALRRLIDTAREFTEGRIITVFGCGGDRDRTKRPAMGEVATSLGDFTVITSDNPRSEDPMEIISGILSGVVGDAYEAVPDRAEAIRLAVEMARRGDTVIIAGKGHESYQEVKGVRHGFSDVEKAVESISAIQGEGRA
jgi:UDP-N-acetylmuramoyl-L-alanyl-D-glutamate--2,6-diaminopimelate ligase